LARLDRRQQRQRARNPVKQGLARGRRPDVRCRACGKSSDQAAFDPALKVGGAFDPQTLDNGFIIRAMGDTIGLRPPLIVKLREVDEMLHLFARILKTVEAKLSSSGLVESRCGAVALGRTYLLPPLSFGGALVVQP
jgi:hypothetical protein